MKDINFAELSFKIGISSFFAWWVIRWPFLKNLDKELKITVAASVLALVFIVLRNLTKTKFSKSCEKTFKNFYWNFLGLFNRYPSSVRKYTVEERCSENYRQALTEQISKSNRIYFRLISAHTMFHDPKETFILEALKKLPLGELEKRDIRIQLLARDCEAFNERARNFIESMEKDQLPERITYDEYLRRCQKIEDTLLRILGEKRIAFYRRKHLWRLHIFDDILFVSSYKDDPDMIQGHLSTAHSFTREFDPSLFDAFLAEFLSLYRTTPPVKSEKDSSL